MNHASDPGDLLRVSHFFQCPDTEILNEVFDRDVYVWDIMDHLPGLMNRFFSETGTKAPLPGAFQVSRWVNREGGDEVTLFVKDGYQADADFICSEFRLAVGKGTVFEPGAVLKPPAIFGRDTEIRQAAYIRGGVLVGDHCTVGHATEVKTAIFMDHTEAGHFAYVGDSVLGNYVNLGAGTRLANLPFRSLKQKQANVFPAFDLRAMNTRIHTGRSKFGAVLGDGVETGCNATLAPGTLVGPDSWIYPCLFLKSGYYPERSVIKPGYRIAIDRRR